MFTDLIKGLELTEEQKDTLKANFELVHADLKAVVENDPTIVKKHKTGAFEEAKRKLIRSLGLDKDEVRDLEYDDLVKMAKDKVSEITATNQNEKDAEIIKLKQKIQKFETETIPSLQAESENKIKEFRIKSKISDVLGGIDTVIGKDSARIVLESKLAQYDLKISDNGEIEVLTKDGLKPTFENKIVSDLPTLAKNLLNADGLVKQNNNGNGNPTPVGVKGDLTDMPKDVLASIEKMKANLVK